MSQSNLLAFIANPTITKEESSKLPLYHWDKTKQHNIVSLTDNDYQSWVETGDENKLVVFYAPWCPHCKKLMPELLALSANVKIGVVDCDVSKKTCRADSNVKSFPTTKAYSKQGSVYYGGERTSEAMKRWMSTLNYLDGMEGSELVTMVDKVGLETMAEDQVKGLLFLYALNSPKSNSSKSVFAKAALLAKENGLDLKFVGADASADPTIQSAFDVDAFPALFAIKDGKYIYLPLANEFTADQLIQGATVALAIPSTERSFTTISFTEKGSMTFSKDVQILVGQREFDYFEEGFVMFFAPWCGACKKTKPVFIEAAAEVPGRFAAMDCTDDENNKVTCDKMKVKSFPTLVYVRNGELVDEYLGIRKKDPFVEFVKSLASKEEL